MVLPSMNHLRTRLARIQEPCELTIDKDYRVQTETLAVQLIMTTVCAYLISRLYLFEVSKFDACVVLIVGNGFRAHITRITV